MQGKDVVPRRQPFLLKLGGGWKLVELVGRRAELVRELGLELGSGLGLGLGLVWVWGWC